MTIPDDQLAKLDRYSRELTDKLEEVALAALRDRKAATLSWSSGSVGFAINRRVLKDGRWTGFGEVPDGPIDHDLPVLKAVGADGSIRAILFEYACHCTTLDPRDNTICADWMGFCHDEIERATSWRDRARLDRLWRRLEPSTTDRPRRRQTTRPLDRRRD